MAGDSTITRCGIEEYLTELDLVTEDVEVEGFLATVEGFLVTGLEVTVADFLTTGFLATAEDQAGVALYDLDEGILDDEVLERGDIGNTKI